MLKEHIRLTPHARVKHSGEGALFQVTLNMNRLGATQVAPLILLFIAT